MHFKNNYSLILYYSLHIYLNILKKIKKFIISI